MNLPWLKNYPQGIPAEIDPDTYSSLAELFDDCCERYHDLPAFYNLGTTLSYAKLAKEARDCAAYFQNVLNLEPGSRVGIMMPNLLQYPVVLFGALKAGLVVVNVNPLYTSYELIHQLNDAGVETLIVLENFAVTVSTSMPHLKTLKNVIITRVGDCLSPFKGMLINFFLKYIQRKIRTYHLPRAVYFKQMMREAKLVPFVSPIISNEDLAFLQYTGGTTGISRGAMLTHRNLIANLLQAEVWFKGLLVERQEIFVGALPLYHIFSLTANCLFSLKMGGLNLLITNPRDIDSLVKDMSKFKFTLISGVNTLFNALVKHPRFKQLDFSALKLTLGGGMAVQQAVAEAWEQITGKILLEAYGLTETSPCVTINPYTLQKFNGSIGLPVSSTKVGILDEKGNEVALGEPGELAVKGPQVMKGYWNHLEKNNQVFTSDGWLLTGDMARMDEGGFVYLLERKKDMILVSGFNVYPSELENVIARLKGVREVAVVGITNETSGEVPKAYIVKDDATLTEADVIAYCRKHLTGYKIPKAVAFLPELPKSNVGKILRRALKEKQ